MSSKYKCPECDATNGIAKSQGRTSSVFHFHVRTNERLQDNTTRPGGGTGCRVQITYKSYSRPGCVCTIGGAVKGGGAEWFKRPFPAPRTARGVTYQLVLRTVRFDASHLSANPWEGAPSATGGRQRSTPVCVKSFSQWT